MLTNKIYPTAEAITATTQPLMRPLPRWFGMALACTLLNLAGRRARIKPQAKPARKPKKAKMSTVFIIGLLSRSIYSKSLMFSGGRPITAFGPLTTMGRSMARG